MEIIYILKRIAMALLGICYIVVAAGFFPALLWIYNGFKWYYIPIFIVASFIVIMLLGEMFFTDEGI